MKKNYIYKLLFFISILLIFKTAIYSQKVIEIDDKLTSKKIGLYIEYYEDKEAKLTIAEALTEQISSKFIKSRDSSPGFGYTSSAYWIRFNVINPLDREIECFLEIAYPLLDKITFYIPDKDRNFIVKKAGDSYPFHKREFDHQNFIFPLKTEARTIYLLYQD